METKKVKETELEKELKQMNNDVLYRVMQCFNRKAKELNIDSSDIFLRADEQDKSIDVFKNTMVKL